MTTEVQIVIHQRGTELPLVRGWNALPIDEAPCLIRVVGKGVVRLNGALLRVVAESSDLRVFAFDFSNAVGSHDLSVASSDGREHVYSFETSSTKLLSDELDAMIDVCSEHVYGNKRQFLYQTSTGERAVAQSKKSLLRWLDARMAEIVQIVASLDASPGTSPQQAVATSPRSRGLDLRSTSAYLRSNPHLLEQREDGAVMIEGRRYMPALVRVKAPIKSVPIVEHRQLQSWLQDLIQSMALVWSQSRGRPSQVVMHEESVHRLLNTRILSNVSLRQAGILSLEQSTPLQRLDGRYRRLREIMIEFGTAFSRSMPSESGLRANLKDIWEIYQTYACHIVGLALGLQHVSGDFDLRKRDRVGASMRSQTHVLFFDASPSKYLTSWRAGSRRPAGERPDIVVVDVAQGRCLLVDVKFSVDGPIARRCRSEHLFEMQGYLNSYKLTSGGVIFPGFDSSGERIENDGYKLHAIPIRPIDICSREFSAALADVADSLEKLWTPITNGQYLN